MTYKISTPTIIPMISFKVGCFLIKYDVGKLIANKLIITKYVLVTYLWNFGYRDVVVIVEIHFLKFTFFFSQKVFKDQFIYI